MSSRNSDGRRPGRPRPAGRASADQAPGDAVRQRTRRLQTLIEATRTRSLSLYELAPFGYVLLDEQGQIESMNLTLSTLLGQHRGYMQGLPFLLLIANEDRERFLRYLDTCRNSNGEALACDVTLIGSNRTGAVPVHLITRRVHGHNGEVKFLCSIIDEREKADALDALRESGRQLKRTADQLSERTRQAEDAAGRLRGMAREVNRAEQRERQRIARLLHDDLQQLLVSAKMRLHMIRPGKVPPAQIEEVTQLIDAAINSSRSLTAQISPPLLQDAGLEPGLRWLARFFRDQHHLAVDLDVALGDAPIDFSDRDFLFQAAREMLFNVVKHAGVSDARLRARVTGRRIDLEVRDAGDGFDARSLAETGGDRLGLRTLRERVGLLGGTFLVDSSPDRGTQVRISFPLCDVEPPPQPGFVRPQYAAAGRGPRSPRVRVLIADDHRTVREGLQSFLSREDWLEIVGQASDGRQAVLMTRELQPDVVIMDITMPEMNGIEATRIITGENPRVRIIGLSMHQQEDMASAMLSAGAERYLTKGGPAGDLVQAVRELGIPAHGDSGSGRDQPEPPVQ